MLASVGCANDPVTCRMAGRLDTRTREPRIYPCLSKDTDDNAAYRSALKRCRYSNDKTTRSTGPMTKMYSIRATSYGALHLWNKSE
jgi:hypothetical protein